MSFNLVQFLCTFWNYFETPDPKITYKYKIMTCSIDFRENLSKLCNSPEFRFLFIAENCEFD